MKRITVDVLLDAADTIADLCPDCHEQVRALRGALLAEQKLLEARRHTYIRNRGWTEPEPDAHPIRHIAWFTRGTERKKRSTKTCATNLML